MRGQEAGIHAFQKRSALRSLARGPGDLTECRQNTPTLFICPSDTFPSHPVAVTPRRATSAPPRQAQRPATAADPGIRSAPTAGTGPAAARSLTTVWPRGTPPAALASRWARPSRLRTRTACRSTADRPARPIQCPHRASLSPHRGGRGGRREWAWRGAWAMANRTVRDESSAVRTSRPLSWRERPLWLNCGSLLQATQR